jgi:MoxR-like ATPase
MALPSIIELRRPVLEAHADGETLATAEVIERLVPIFLITAEELSARQASGDNTMAQRVGWARSDLVRTGMLEQPAPGRAHITERGSEALASGVEIGPPPNDWASQPVSREAVLQAMAELDGDGHEPVLRRHGYRQALDYTVVHEDVAYAAKGLYGIAYSIQYPDEEPIRNRGISSGKDVAAKLEALGFTVQSRRDRGERVWVIRAGATGQHESLALDEGVAVIGWSDLGPIGLDETRDDLKRRISETWDEHRPAALGTSAGQIYRFIHEVKLGDLVVLPRKRPRNHVAIGRMAGEYLHRDSGPFADTDAQHTREVDWLVRDLPYERFDPDLRDAFGQQGTVSEISKPDAAERLLAVVDGEDASAIHLVLKWSPAGGAEPEEFAAVAAEHGAAWWGRGEPGTPGFSEQTIEKLRSQLAQGSTTAVFLHGTPSTWRSELLDVTTEMTDVDPGLRPASATGEHGIWFKLARIERAEPSEIIENYVQVSSAQPPTLGALGTQGPLILRRASGVTTGRYFVVDGALRNGDAFAWTTDTSGAAQLLAQSAGASFVTFDGEYLGTGRVASIDADGDNYVATIADYAAFTRRVGAADGPDRTAELAIGQITRTQFDRLVELGRGGAVFGVDSVRRLAEARGLNLDPDIYAQLIAALTSGKHVILTGPPGTAKTTLAQAVADAARAAGECQGYLLTTATADWTTYETIGGLRPTGANALEFEEGHFLKAIRDGQWLVIDELNRSHFDRAFGQLFTVLSGQAVVLPYRRPGAGGPLALVPEGVAPPAGDLDVLEIPQSWRVIATMNVFDKSLLFEMSFALMRRFAFIEVASPTAAVFEALIDDSANDPRPARLAKQLLDLRELTDLGPAVYMDLAKYLRQRIALADVEDGQLVFEAFYSYLLPQFEGIDATRGQRLFELVGARLDSDQRRERLRRTLNAVLGLEL